MTITLKRRELDLRAEDLTLNAIVRRLELSGRRVRRRPRALCDRLGFAAPVQAVETARRDLQ
ncbi:MULTISPECIES: hypothetical protein [Amycolatopsis]|uniref:Uncharacterized protein n=2 Tax=Amycolatopsis TaxID=1813 RepID=A0A1I3KFL5_9PSEU|nr:hypothetical protein [Amycolatopsis sacchari]SFI71299.1 hypothetical protein SAMN05421835_101540 [Amycolatopsis sacchari]